MKHLLLLCFSALLLGAPMMASGAENSGIRRFALVIGANDGGPKRVELQYATTDAEAVAQVLQDLGGVSAQDTILLLDPDRAGLSAAMDHLGERVSAAQGQHARTEVVLYYSGHSDEEGLRLGQELVPYSDLRAALFEIESDVRLAILDSCASGTMTRTKGGSFQAPFLVDDANKVKGYAILTSSSADEAAQESDRIGASFFTHSLVSGLRGAADNTGDGRVTLNEVYHYAFNDTLARTEKTQAGAQHPAYDIQLVGTGDLVLTDLRQTAASLELAENLKGRVFIRDADGHLIFELRKIAGQAMSLALAPGEYAVTVEIDGKLHAGELQLDYGDERNLDLSDLIEVTPEVVALRGDDPDAAERSVEDEDGIPRQFKVNLEVGGGERLNQYNFELNFDWGLMPGLNALTYQPKKADSVRFQLNLFTAFAPRITGFQGSLFYNHVYGDMLGTQISALMNQSEGHVRGAQLAPIFNIGAGTVKGFQGTGLFNIAGQGLYGYQGSALFNIAGNDSRGLQTTGVFNVTDGVMDGAQLAGGFNVASQGGKLYQAAGLLNIAGGDLYGSQMSGFINQAHFIEGAQIGVINIANHIDGTQVGLVNIANQVEGGQFGLINMADTVNGTSLGLLSFVRNGQHHLDLYINEMGMTNLSLRLGGPRHYTMINAGSKLAPDTTLWSTGFGAGTRFGREEAFMNVDVLAETLYDSGWSDHDLNMVVRARTYVGLELLGPFAIFGGLTYNAHIRSAESDIEVAAPSFGEVSAVSGEEINIDMWPGIIFGVEL